MKRFKYWNLYRDGKIVANTFDKKNIEWWKSFFITEWPNHSWHIVERYNQGCTKIIYGIGSPSSWINT